MEGDAEGASQKIFCFNERLRNIYPAWNLGSCMQPDNQKPNAPLLFIYKCGIDQMGAAWEQMHCSVRPRRYILYVAIALKYRYLYSRDLRSSERNRSSTRRISLLVCSAKLRVKI